MPTFTAIALERLLEPTVEESPQINPLKPEPKKKEEVATAAKRSSHIYISPALYATPKSTPIPYSPASVSPSPYVVNRKLREVRAAENRQDGFEVGDKTEESRVLDGGDEDVCPPVPFLEEKEENEQKEKDGSLLDVEIVGGDAETLFKESDIKRDEGCLDDFADTRDSMSIASSCDTDDGAYSRQSTWKHTSLTSQSEFYDAPEDFISDCSTPVPSPSVRLNFEVELRALRLNLYEEIERRKKAEEGLDCIHNLWNRIGNHLSQFGLSFPLPSDAGNAHPEIDSAEQFCQEIVVTRFVSEAVGRGLARAETEAAAEAVIACKNREIARLQDKLQYYEAVNHEMSQRNQEVIEMSRRQRKAKKMRQRWMWGCIGLSIAAGASVLLYTHLPETGNGLLSASAESSSPSMPESGEFGR